MSQAPMDWYKALHGWMEQIGFIRSENDKAVWYHPSGLKVGSYNNDVDACIARGLHRWFWAEAAKRFKIKQWGFVEVEQPQMLCSKLIQKCVDPEGVHWYSIYNYYHIRAWLIEWLIEQDVWGCRTVQAPMPDKEELLGDMRAVTAQVHKWYSSVI